MLQIVKGLPDNVIGIMAKGRVTKEECDTVLRPALESSLKRASKPRLYYEIGCRFPGAGWADLEIGLDHLPQWQRIAVVTDTAWVRQTVNALRFLLATEVRVFTTFETAESRAWITSAESGDDEVGLGAVIPPFRAPPPPRIASPSRPGGRRYRRPSAGGR
jgi:hypothetical protein